MNFLIKDKVALVTGANRGIGKAIVESFLQHGARKVYLAVRDIKSTQALCQQYGDKVVTLALDVSDAESIKQAVLLTQDVDVVVNNAGVLEIADPLADNAEVALQHEFDVNVLGLIRIAKAYANTLTSKGSSAFVQLNSVASIKNFTPFTTYSASKAASYSVTQGLKDVFAPKGIQVLSVHPGPIKTDMGDKAGFDVADSVESVSEGIVAALAEGEFHLFPDSVAKHFEGAYQSFADGIINAEQGAE
ncbi:SDR family oxidoreductase [Paraglaciecola hydrolytica]|uniref:Short-chain dehydrogenase n=1 Tax=Paraglaciecola hydrolytica TaxID=1799789 RepID=A0A136A582_9ALTE|nr:SDR family oxidoreductase [Paraglaciecola hydrolytica]KXI30387.1 short-chain dehydrogenase [Paraglaciecola hydrolytica]